MKKNKKFGTGNSHFGDNFLKTAKNKKFGTGNSHVGDGLFDGYDESAHREPPSDPVLRRVLEEVGHSCGLKCAWEV